MFLQIKKLIKISLIAMCFALVGTSQVQAVGTFSNPIISPNGTTSRADVSIYSPITITFPDINGNIACDNPGGISVSSSSGSTNIAVEARGNSLLLTPKDSFTHETSYNFNIKIQANSLSFGTNKNSDIDAAITFKTEYKFDKTKLADIFKVKPPRSLNVYVSQFITSININNTTIPGGTPNTNFTVVSIDVNKHPLASKMSLSYSGGTAEGILANNGKETVFNFGLVNLPNDTDLTFTAKDIADRPLDTVIYKFNSAKVTDSKKIKDLSNGGKPYGLQQLIASKALFQSILALDTGVTLREKVYVDEVTLDVSAGKIFGTDQGMEYSTDATNSANGTWRACTNSSTDNVNFIAGKNVYIREIGNASNFKVIKVTTGKFPQPKYTIDYINEKTKEIVAPDIEYSDNESFSSKNNGAGTQISLEPGKIYYFRYKATALEGPGPVCKLAVPERPKAPVVTIDYANNKAAVSTNMQYSMKKFTDTNYSAFASITERWLLLERGAEYKIRTKASASAFYSEEYSINYGGVERVPENLVIDYTNEKVVIPKDKEIEYSWDQKRWTPGNGDLYILPGDKEKILYYRLKPAANYSSKTLELKVPARPILDFAIDFDKELVNNAIDDLTEFSWDNFKTVYTLAADGGFLDGGKIKLTPENKEKNLYIRKKTDNTKTFASKASLILKIPARPARPRYTVDYITEKTKEAVPTTVQYSEGSLAYTSSVGKQVLLTPNDTGEKTINFRVASTAKNFCSENFPLVVPERTKAAPQVPTIDYIFEKTNESISTNIEYSTDVDFVTKSTAQGKAIKITPGEDLFFRYKSDGSGFASKVAKLEKVARQPQPVKPNIDYEKESIGLAADTEYSTDSDFSKDVHSGVALVKVTPGINIFIRKKATTIALAGEKLEIIIPSAPSAPEFMVDNADAVNLKTVQIVSKSIEYYVGSKLDMDKETDLASKMTKGTDAILSLEKGKKYCFRKKAVLGSSFAGEVQELEAK